MDGHFKAFLRRLRLTESQEEDAVSKYRAVSETLHEYYYGSDYDGSTQLLIGSYGKKTNIQPPGDVDLLFKIPRETYERFSGYQGNGQSALLQEVREVLQDEFETAEEIKAWGKVVLVKFEEDSHNIELLPAYEQEDKSFVIPNTEGEGKWDYFDPRSEKDAIDKSDEVTEGRTRELVRAIKRWKDNCTVNMESYEVELAAMDFLAFEDSGTSWSERVSKFFEWWRNDVGQHSDQYSHIQTASARAARAVELESEDRLDLATEEWRKVFGDSFPEYDDGLEEVYELENSYPSPVEEFIEGTFPVKINPEYQISIQAEVNQNGFRRTALAGFLQDYAGLQLRVGLIFSVTSNVDGRVKYYWKVRNFYEEARDVDGGQGLRGEITKDQGERKTERTLYHGTHYVECYAIVDGICVASQRLPVPINREVTRSLTDG